jgi:hypothetical protein
MGFGAAAQFAVAPNSISFARGQKLWTENPEACLRTKIF